MIWDEIYDVLNRSPAKLKVVKKMIESGISIKDGKLSINGIRIDDAKFANTIAVDRRVVKDTIDMIEKNLSLKRFFENLKAFPDLTDSAREMGWGSMEVIVEDASKPGILAGISRIISQEGISIRQAFVDDPEISEEPKLHVVTQSKIPGDLLQKLMNLDDIKKITIK